MLDFFGDREIFDGSKRSSFVIADKDCTLYKIDAETFKDLVTTNQTIADNINKVEKFESVGLPEGSSSI